jgi:NhaP-type Na+/H+ or K+/H+ antiporter
MNSTLALICASVLVLGLTRSAIRRTRWIPAEPFIATVIGFLFGPHVLNAAATSLRGGPGLLEATARITIALTIMSMAVSFPWRLVRNGWKPLILGIALLTFAMWIVSAAVAVLVLPLQLWLCLTIAAAIAPTDPVLAGSVASGQLAREHLPGRIRHFIRAESACNDALAYPLVYFSLAVAAGLTTRELRSLMLETLAMDVAGAGVLGAVLGFVAGKLTSWARQNDHAESFSGTAIITATSLGTMACSQLVGGDGFIAVLMAGLSFSFVMHDHDIDLRSDLDATVLPFFSVPVFFLFGAFLPVADWRVHAFAFTLLTAGSLFLRRLPFMFLNRSHWPLLRRTRDAVFVGWFGPIGIAALYYGLVAARKTHEPVIHAAVSAVVLGSIIVHGLTATELTKRFPER